MDIPVTFKGFDMEPKEKERKSFILPQVSLGDILILISGIVSMVIAYFTLVERISVLETERRDDQEASVEFRKEVKDSLREINQRLDGREPLKGR